MRRSAFRQSDLTKALKAAKAAGSEVARVEIAPDGRMVVVMTKDAAQDEKNELLDAARKGAR
jgi:hypothetical protein